MFNEICIYEAKIDKQDEIEALMKEVAEFYPSQSGVIDIKYIKGTYRQEDFNALSLKNFCATSILKRNGLRYRNSGTNLCTSASSDWKSDRPA